MKFSRNKLVIAAVLVIMLGVTFWYGGNAPGLQGWNTAAKTNDSAQKPVQDLELESQDEEALEILPEEEEVIEVAKEDQETEEAEGNKESLEEIDQKEADEEEKVEEVKEEVKEKVKKAEKKSEPAIKINPDTGKDKYSTDPIPQGKPVPIEPENSQITNIEKSATLSVRCDTILDNMDWLNPDKVELVPEDGVIYASKKVIFYEGESVFNLLLREMKKAKIHMEFVNTPIYNSAYIEGINNLYEFDCGELSGWMYKVNDWFPNYGCSRYALKDGDTVEWLYTCDLGTDIGGSAAAGGNR